MKAVHDYEREEAAQIVSDFRENEVRAAANDIGARQSMLDDHAHNPFKMLSPTRLREINVEILECSPDIYAATQERAKEVRFHAYDLATIILARLVQVFDAEMQQAAIAAERRLVEAGIPLHNPDKSDWELWHQNEILYRHAWRECCRNKHDSLDMNDALGAIQWLATDEANPPFTWL